MPRPERTLYAYDITYDQSRDVRVTDRSRKIAAGKAVVYWGVILFLGYKQVIQSGAVVLFMLLVVETSYLEHMLCKLTDIYDRHIIRMDRNSQLLEQRIEQLEQRMGASQ